MKNNSNDEQRRKRIVWRASHRGIREMDLVLGGFVQRHIHTMAATELDQVEQILDIPDQDLLAWLTGTSSVPARFETKMLRRLLQAGFDVTTFRQTK